MDVSSRGRAFLRAHEGEVLTGYLDPIGVPTIGTGATNHSKVATAYLKALGVPKGKIVPGKTKLCASALTLAGCISSTPASVPGLRATVGSSLPGAKGLTIEDQYRINDTVAGGCAGAVYTRAECSRHTEASADRRTDLQNDTNDGRHDS